MKSLDWPPNFSIKKNPRSRHVKLKTSMKHGLEFIVPKNFKEKDIPFLLEEHKPWIEKQLLKLQSELKAEIHSPLPTEIFFPLLDQTWRIHYISSNSKLQLIPRPHQELALLGKIENKKECKKLLHKWIKHQAKLNLPGQLRHLSEGINLPFDKVTIRDQNTRWGSCSANKSINLNYKLILLPKELAKHVMIHELCHTIYLNHSDKFWNLVEKFDPNYQIHKKSLRKISEVLPKF